MIAILTPPTTLFLSSLSSNFYPYLTVLKTHTLLILGMHLDFVFLVPPIITLLNWKRIEYRTVIDEGYIYIYRERERFLLQYFLLLLLLTIKPVGVVLLLLLLLLLPPSSSSLTLLLLLLLLLFLSFHSNLI